MRAAKDFSNEVSANNWDTLASRIRTVKSLNMLETGIIHFLRGAAIFKIIKNLYFKTKQ